MIQPLNDVLKVETSHDEYNFGGEEKEGTESGIVIAVSDKLNYFGFNSFAFDTSLGKEGLLEDLLNFYGSLVGKRVYWSAYKERGSVFKEGDKTFAFIKMTDLIGYSEVEEDAETINVKNGGAFNPAKM